MFLSIFSEVDWKITVPGGREGALTFRTAFSPKDVKDRFLIGS